MPRSSVVRLLLVAALAVSAGCVQYTSRVQERISGPERLVDTDVRPEPGSEAELFEFTLEPAGPGRERLACERVVLADVQRVRTYERPVTELRSASCRAPLWLVVLPVADASSGERGPYWLLPYSLRLAQDLLEGQDADELLETKGVACVLFGPVLALDALTLPYHLWCMARAERDVTVSEHREEREPDTVVLRRRDATPRLREVVLRNARGDSLVLDDARGAFDLSPLVDPADRDLALEVRALYDGRAVRSELVLDEDDLPRLLRRRDAR
ncbi:MAG: hypothetical protein H6825_08370 [Planctomycetes bacterium]|nr:hypothetical protein [Planctomycetota bacterium]